MELNASFDEIKQVVERKGYKFFDGYLNMNLIGVRNDNVATNEFDDDLFIAMEFGGTKQIIDFNDFTTDPGGYYLKEKLLNPDGCAILIPGQHKGMFKGGKHKGKYDALVQASKVTVARDRNRDNILDMDNLDTGWFGINMHHAYDRENVGPYSAGCQVHSTDEQLGVILALYYMSSSKWGEKLSYTLLEKKDFG